MMDVTLAQLENSTELFAEASTGNKQWVAVIADTHPTYNYEREFVAYQKPKTTKRDSGRAQITDGAVIETVRYTHSGKNDTRVYYQLVDGELHKIDDTEITQALEGEIVPDVGPDQDIIDDLMTLDGVGESRAIALAEAGYESAADVRSADASDLECVDGIGPATASKLTATDEPEPTPEATSEPVAVCDGGLDYDDYDIDLDNDNFDIINRTHDSTNNITYVLGRFEGTDLWVHYSTTQTGPGEWSEHIKGIGNLSLNGPELDLETVAEGIREATADIIEPDRDDWTSTEEILSEVAERADEIAESVVNEWRIGCTEIVDDRIWEGVAGICNGGAWYSHVQEALYHETVYTLSKLDIDEDEHGFAVDCVRRGLYEGVDTRRNRWLKPHLEYEVRFEFNAEPWELRTLELQQRSVLPEKTARVFAMYESGMMKSDIAAELDVGASTITRQVNRANRMIDEAKWTVENTVVNNA